MRFFANLIRWLRGLPWVKPATEADRQALVRAYRDRFEKMAGNSDALAGYPRRSVGPDRDFDDGHTSCGEDEWTSPIREPR